jgi:glutamine amidotransferase PdxT
MEKEREQYENDKAWLVQQLDAAHARNFYGEFVISFEKGQIVSERQSQSLFPPSRKK